MQTRVALIAIIVEEYESINTLNDLLSQYRDYIIGRMGIPYRERDISVMSVAVDAPMDVINTLSGSIGKLKGVTAKTVYSKVVSDLEGSNERVD